MKIKNVRVVVAKPDGSAVFSPFPPWVDSVGSTYWLSVGESKKGDKAVARELEYGKNNEVSIPAEIMKEIPLYMKVLRPDGSYAIAIRTKRGSASHKLAFGGEVVISDEAKPYLENGENNSFIPESAIDVDSRQRLRVFDYYEGYTTDIMEDE